MSTTRGLLSVVVLALLLSAAAGPSRADTNPAPDSSDERSSTVVGSVRDGGFQWADAGVGAAAALATTLLVLGLVLTVRPDRGDNANP